MHNCLKFIRLYLNLILEILETSASKHNQNFHSQTSRYTLLHIEINPKLRSFHKILIYTFWLCNSYSARLFSEISDCYNFIVFYEWNNIFKYDFFRYYFIKFCGNAFRSNALLSWYYSGCAWVHAWLGLKCFRDCGLNISRIWECR